MNYVYEMPQEMLADCEKKGTVERFEYDTFTYDEGDNRPLKKGAYAKLLKPGVNYDFYVIPGRVHDMKAWQLHLYHALQVFFR